MERAYTRARDLCERLGDSPELFSVLPGLHVIHHMRAELRWAFKIAEQLLARAQIAQHPTLLLNGHLALGETSYWLGELLSAREHYEMSISFFDQERLGHPSGISMFDEGIVGISHAALTLSQLGYPDQALERGSAALALAKELSRPFSLADAKLSAVFLYKYRREQLAAQQIAESLSALSEECGLSQYVAYSTILRGWQMTRQGQNKLGIVEMQKGLAASRAAGDETTRPYFLCFLAEACMETGRLDDGQTALAEALAAADEREVRNYEAETRRLMGELLMGQKDSNAVEAQRCFERAIELHENRAPNH